MSRPHLTRGQPLCDMVVSVRLDARRGAVVREMAGMNEIDNAEVVRRMMDFFIDHHILDLREVETLRQFLATA